MAGAAGSGADRGAPVRLTLAISFAAALFAGAAVACEPPIVPEVDLPVEVLPDGSFSKAEDNDYDALFGGKTTDIGGGLVVQIIGHAAYCDFEEVLVLTDCDSAEMIGIRGAPGESDPPGMNGGPFLVELILPPAGRLDLAAVSTLDDARALSRDAGYVVTEDYAGAWDWVAPQNQFDLFIGCKLHYPASRGASQ